MRDIKIGEDWTVPNPDGVGRRTLVKGTAWSVPVVAMAVGAPFAAASGNPTLAFTLPSYSGTPCSDIVGVKVQLTTDGTTPAGAGEPVSVTLANGYTFASGGSTWNGFTQADGSVTLPDIVVPARGGNSIFNAASGTLTASAQVTAPAVIGGQVYDGSGALYGGSPQPTGIVSVYSTRDTNGVTQVQALDSNGVLWGGGPSGWSQANTGVTDVVSNDGAVFYVKDGQVYDGTGALYGGSPQPTGIVSVYSTRDTNGVTQVQALDSNGVLWGGGPSGWSQANTGVTDVVSNDGAVFYVKDGQVYDGTGALYGGSPQPTGIVSVYSTRDTNGVTQVQALDSNGVLWGGGPSGWSQANTGVTDVVSNDGAVFYVKGPDCA
ncbi:hypothetical protein GSU68_17955 [Rathayibacter sp. VKM Ac-2759]|uniref:hypothetical protein n=1 Tax=Rathayibacter sp. VKM Ac-2759 TaxID=2609252 RepID=UPI0013177428|nr:hypothetical protein [Rathayibacter sp. VKM Ac-2759]QHC68269.1 hypothetical protein GSU68_17955 [Rathayibacter sp. VKM Ac-2759]